MGKSNHLSGQPQPQDYSLFNNPEKDWEILLYEASGTPPEPSLFD